ncbi:MAG TPA: Rieske 2Fe-2S domain-containing protein [Terriglobales bacterium]|jgi:ubiquinol-cytochrome c reductase iron-sulfur subunit|nr:Rieske 2Fe-2S domain-containing protein [Terriglobales bacterium]
MKPEHGEEERTGTRLAVVLVFAWQIFRSLAAALARIFLGKPAVTFRTKMAPARRATETGRSADLDQESQSEFERRGIWGTLFLLCAFAVSAAAGVKFLFVYWTGGNNLLLGSWLALFLAGIGAALVFTAHWLMRHKEAFEPREQLQSTEQEREKLQTEFSRGEHGIQRRTLLQLMAASGVGIFAAIVVSLMRSLGPAPGQALFPVIWKRGQRLMTLENKQISIDTLEPGSTVVVFPENSVGDEKAQTILIRVNQRYLRLPKDRTNWAPMGYVAYSRVCTHAGCPVGLFETTTDLLLCPCHQSTFDVLRAACPTGGPAARALPQLPLYADADGTLRAAGDFSEPPGPGFRGLS